MSVTACPNCGHALEVDALSGEAKPCEYCGANATGTPEFDPEHQGRINRQKAFELGIVILIVLVGLGYYSISRGGLRIGSDEPVTSPALAAVLESRGFEPAPGSDFFGRSFETYTRSENLLDTTVDIVSRGDSDDAETIVIVAGLPEGLAFPIDAVAEPAIQRTFNDMVELSSALIPGCDEALSRAAATVTRAGNPGVTHNKGVAQTHHGWKVTYIAWREYEEQSGGIPLLALIHQRLDIEPEPDFEAFNRALYAAINDAKDVKLTLSEHEEASAQR